jgi:outer membrane biosynthesis protein TonB
MFWKKSEYNSTLVSILFHLGLLALLMAFKISPKVDLSEYVTIGFGNVGNSNSAGAIKQTEPQEEVIETKKENEIEIPKVQNYDETNDVTSAKLDEKNKKAEKETEKASRNEGVEDGVGSFGFELDFGGKGQRKIYSYIIPPYPSGVSKEIDVKLQFTIMPDGSVGRIFPIQKADARLESVAMNSLRQWRFEALPKGIVGKPQTAVITFPFRLR